MGWFDDMGGRLQDLFGLNQPVSPIPDPNVIKWVNPDAGKPQSAIGNAPSGKLSFAPPEAPVQATPQPQPVPQQSPTIGPSPQISPDMIAQGMNRFAQQSGSPVPLATMSAELAQAGQGLPDPLLPAVVALMESGGGQHMTTPNNPYNIGPGVQYPDLRTAILGGGPNNQRGLNGVLKGGLYDDYIKSGNLQDFFNKYTPPGGVNPTMSDLLSRYASLHRLFH